jgi:UDP-N-acetylmuramate dehydrogenase
MLVEKNVPLQPYNTFGIARAQTLVRVRHWRTCGPDGRCRTGPQPKWVLGGGSNIVLTGDVRDVVLKMEIKGLRVCEEPRAWIVEAGAGERWHDTVAWTWTRAAGLENLALIPGTVGAAPVQNIGAYGVELQDRFESLDGHDLVTGQTFARCGAMRLRLPRLGVQAPRAGRAGGRRAAPGLGLAGRAVITRVRLRLPKPWKPELGYLDLERSVQAGVEQPTARQIFDWVCEIRRAKLPDPARSAMPAASSRTPRSRPSSAPTSSRATRASCTTPWPTAASSWPPAG